MAWATAFAPSRIRASEQVANSHASTRWLSGSPGTIQTISVKSQSAPPKSPFICHAPAATEVSSGLLRINLDGPAEVRDGPVRWQTTSQGVVLQFDASVDVAQRLTWSESHGFVVIGDRLGMQSPACPCVTPQPHDQRVAWFELNCRRIVSNLLFAVALSGASPRWALGNWSARPATACWSAPGPGRQSTSTAFPADLPALAQRP